MIKRSFLFLLLFLVLPYSCGKRMVGPDNIPPTAEILSPENGDTVPDTAKSIEIKVEATDNKKVTKVDFYIDSHLAYTDTTPPWTYIWPTVVYEDSSSHNIQAKAYDQAGNVGLSSVITVLIRVKSGLFLVGSFNSSANAYDVFVKNNYVYVANKSEGLKIFDVSDPSNPFETGRFNTTEGFALAVFVSGNYAYLANGVGGLLILDVSNPYHPDTLVRFNTSGQSKDVFVSGDYAYVADDNNGLQIIDISDPAHPGSVASYRTNGSANGIYVSGNYAYIANWTGLQIVDISDPHHPDSVGFSDRPASAIQVFVSGNYAYVASQYEGLYIFDISNPAHPIMSDSNYTDGRAYGVFVKDTLAYVAQGADGFSILNVAQPFKPKVVAKHTSGFANNVYVDRSLIFLADNTTLSIFRYSVK